MAAVVGCLRIGLNAQNPPEPKTAVAARNLLEGWYEVPKRAGVVAKDVAGRVQGVLFFRNEPPVVRILYMTVLDRRRGFGTQLLHAIRDLCAKKGVKELVGQWSEKDAIAGAF